MSEVEDANVDERAEEASEAGVTTKDKRTIPMLMTYETAYAAGARDALLVEVNAEVDNNQKVYEHLKTEIDVIRGQLQEVVNRSVFLSGKKEGMREMARAIFQQIGMNSSDAAEDGSVEASSGESDAL